MAEKEEQQIDGKADDQPVDTTAAGPLSSMFRAIIGLPSLVLIGGVRLYHITLSPIFGRQCRFDPTCSNYFIGAVKKNGAIVGSIRGILRIARCHPFHPGGYDPP